MEASCVITCRVGHVCFYSFLSMSCSSSQTGSRYTPWGLQLSILNKKLGDCYHHYFGILMDNNISLLLMASRKECFILCGAIHIALNLRKQ